MHKLLEIIGNPHHDYKIIHVAGTKGKGSICALTTSILTQAGFKTGFYSSPHMIELTERFRIGNKEISKNQIVYYANSLQDAINSVEGISTFEIMTGLAFKYFSDEHVDIAVVEVGMGGRLDATNVVDPIVTAISSISLDHTQILGHTLKKIAAEKAGIIKEGIPVISAPQKESVKSVLRHYANEKNARLVEVEQKCFYEVIDKTIEEQQVKINCFNQENNGLEKPEITQKDYMLRIPLIGNHQVDNVMTSLLIIDELRQMGWEIHQKEIINGIEKVNWPGRFEIIKKDPIIVVDGAHNVSSFLKLRDTIKEYLPGKNVIMIFGVSEDKQVKLMLKSMKKVVNRLIITKSDHPRALEPEKIEKIARDLKFNDMEVFQEIRMALLKTISGIKKDEVIIASGSLFIAGAVKAILKDRKKSG